MLRQSLRSLAVAAVAVLTLGLTPAAAVTSVSACQDLDKPGETYVLTADITAPATCFRILADRITLDLGGHTITGPSPFSEMGVSDNGFRRTLTVVRNGTITSFGWGLFLAASTRTTVRNVSVLVNADGMEIGPDSLVKDCTVRNNVRNGIEASDRVQVEACLIEQNNTNGDGLSGGLVGGQRILATRNIIRDNQVVGIRVGSRGTVTHNTVTGNDGEGISVGERSLVTGNTSNENGGDGIEAVCPSTITNNTALDNGGLPINPPTSGNGCVVLHNVTAPPAP